MDLWASDHLLWLVCAAFYLLDNVVLHTPSELLLVSGARGTWGPAFPLLRFRLRHRLITLLAARPPWSLATRTDWAVADSRSPAATRRAIRILNSRRARLAPFRVLAGAQFLTVFVAGPVMTHFGGIGQALLAVGALHTAHATLLTVLLARSRRWFGMSWVTISGVVFECTVSPGSLANIATRLSFRCPPVATDPVCLVLAQSGREAAGRILAPLDTLATDLVDEDEFGERHIREIMQWRERLVAEAGHG